MVRHALDTGAEEVEVTAEAEEEWLQLLLTGPGMGIIGSPDCTPGYYNNEGQPLGKGAEFLRGHPNGAMAFFAYLADWRDNGRFEGIDFR
jgi:hypothetical protein